MEQPIDLDEIGVNQKYDPFNKNNILITKEDVLSILKKVGIKDEMEIKNLEIFQIAFTHKSYSFKKFKEANVQLDDNKDNAPGLQNDDYEVLEFLGDRVVDMAVVNYLIKRYPNQNQGFLTNLKIKIVSGDFMGSKYARYLGLSKWVMMSRHFEHKEGRNNDKVLEDVFEAFIGACFKEFGYYFCENFIKIVLEDTVDFADLIMHDTNYKDMIIKYYQRNKLGHPTFRDREIKGPIHDRIYTVEVVDSNGKIIGVGTEKTKKKADQVAAHKACITVGLLST